LFITILNEAKTVPNANDLQKPVSARGGKREGSGRKKGPWSGKPYLAALKRAAKHRDPIYGKRALERVAERLFQEAINGDVQAAIEIGNRLDGRVPSNAPEHGLSVSFVVRMPDTVTPAQWALDARIIEPAQLSHQPTDHHAATAEGEETYFRPPLAGSSERPPSGQHGSAGASRSTSLTPNVVKWPGPRLGDDLGDKPEASEE
jgi:hypothetical protein